ncbi:MAG: carboxypeptidase-like regulatory domain-containing protein [Bacteroidales bacterium]|nr:carboxypeptidase-like regulatory domain-containing protein [Bacteroidales bacterium]
MNYSSLVKGRFVFLLILLFNSGLNAQNKKGSITGKVSDSKTSEELIGAAITFTSGTEKKGMITGFDGGYTIELEPGVYAAECSYISYKTQKKKY